MKVTEEYIINVIIKVQDYMMENYKWKLNEYDIRTVLEIEHNKRKGGLK